MFLSQDGVVLCMTLRALDEIGILDPSLAADRSLAELCPELTEAGFGALRVAAHSLASTGWISGPPGLEPDEAVLRWTSRGRLAARARDRYLLAGELLASFEGTDPDLWTRPWPDAAIERMGALSALTEDRWRLGADLPDELAAVVSGHLDGALAVPTMLWLHKTGRLDDGAPKVPDGDLGAAVLRLLTALEWVDATGRWTAAGRQACGFALNYGGVATYLPLLVKLPALYRGEIGVSPPDRGASEWHVHRALNLEISAVAHGRYFADTDPIFLDIFNREPIAEQPRFIAEMGCGQGRWLIHLHGLIKERTIRGRALASESLTMVGIDPDPIARELARETLAAAGVPALIIDGDVGDPDGTAATLAEHGLAMDEGLHIRAFIDHERALRGAPESTFAPGWSTGAYIGPRGEAVAAEQVERDLVAHMRRWARACGRHGLVVLEAHCVAPQVAARHLGSLHSVAFDAHQAYSKQYPVDHAAFLRCCDAAGLGRLGHCERRYPSRRPFVAISLNRMVPGGESPLPAPVAGAPRQDAWTPPAGTDLEDGRALHEILFTDGDIRHPSDWCSAATGFVVAGALEAIDRRLERAQRGDTIRVLDYGAGTGTATIELLKACRERGLEKRLARSAVALEVHLVDLPSSWFALGYELLRDCAWTRFHSLRGRAGGFRPLRDLVGEELIDVAMANMVFHLIPARALPAAADGLAGVLAPGGVLGWSAPDLGPASEGSILLHDPNRALRGRWVELLGAEGDDVAGRAPSPAVTAIAREARERLDEKGIAVAQERAERRILPRPLAATVAEAMETRFEGETAFASYEMRNEDIVRGLLVPSNQAEYLPEIADRSAREAVIRELMLEDVLPALQEGPAGTGLGLNLHWTLGAHRRP